MGMYMVSPYCKSSIIETETYQSKDHKEKTIVKKTTFRSGYYKIELNDDELRGLDLENDNMNPFEYQVESSQCDGGEVDWLYNNVDKTIEESVARELDDENINEEEILSQYGFVSTDVTTTLIAPLVLKSISYAEKEKKCDETLRKYLPDGYDWIEAIIISGEENDIADIPNRVMSICSAIHPAIKLTLITRECKDKDSYWSIEVKGIGKNLVGLNGNASEEISQLLMTCKKTDIIDWAKRSALLYLSMLISKLGFSTLWVNFGGEGQYIYLENGEHRLADYIYETSDETSMPELKKIIIHGEKRQDMCRYFDLFYENASEVSWLLMEKKQALREPRLIS